MWKGQLKHGATSTRNFSFLCWALSVLPGVKSDGQGSSCRGTQELTRPSPPAPPWVQSCLTLLQLLVKQIPLLCQVASCDLCCGGFSACRSHMSWGYLSRHSSHIQWEYCFLRKNDSWSGKEKSQIPVLVLAALLEFYIAFTSSSSSWHCFVPVLRRELKFLKVKIGGRRHAC